MDHSTPPRSLAVYTDNRNYIIGKLFQHDNQFVELAWTPPALLAERVPRRSESFDQVPMTRYKFFIHIIDVHTQSCTVTYVKITDDDGNVMEMRQQAKF